MKFRSPGAAALHIALTSGHTLVIPPEGVSVPTQFRREAISQGAEPLGADGSEATFEHADPALTLQGSAAVSTEARKKMIADALLTMLNGNDEADFTAAGLPNLGKLKVVAGFNVSRAEADAVWAEVQAAEAGKPGPTT